MAERVILFGIAVDLATLHTGLSTLAADVARMRRDPFTVDRLRLPAFPKLAPLSPPVLLAAPPRRPRRPS